MATPLPDIPLSYGIENSPEQRVREVQFEGFYSQRAADGIQDERQVWSLNWDRVTQAQAEELRAFFKGLRGVSAFLWTPEGQDTELKFVGRNPRYRKTGYDSWDVSVTAIQVFDAAA
jgi:phage-related protein